LYQHETVLVQNLIKRASARVREREIVCVCERERHTQIKYARNLQQLLTLSPEESRHNVPLMHVLARGGVDLFQVGLN
jgi:hypothetical protein